MSVRGDNAVVLLATNEPPQVYPYEVHCFRESGAWHEGSSSNGCGWSSSGGGVMTLWSPDALPEDVVAIVVESRGRRHEVQVDDGYFLFVEWNVAGNDEEPAWPTVIERKLRT